AIRVLEPDAAAGAGRAWHSGALAGGLERPAARRGGRVLPERAGRAADSGDGGPGASVSAGAAQGAVPGAAAEAASALDGQCDLHGSGDGAKGAAEAGASAGCAGRFVYRAGRFGGAARRTHVSRI